MLLRARIKGGKGKEADVPRQDDSTSSGKSTDRPRDDQRDIRVPRSHDTATRKVSSGVTRLGSRSRDSEQNGPADDTDDKDRHDWEPARLAFVGKGCEEQHDDEGDHVWGYGKELRLLCQPLVWCGVIMCGDQGGN
jgi:hypothetical protein